ncbi:virulence factor MviN [Buchnera aphidicola str. Bp (Baizongia pistaciae)]|uniref:Probable lipid II flippase MurJ n=1 Tax=Buchnera aphidicola subsp. Baizongia pistaciae (strain Bp) TaxID=224915 RepID=MURJ_BUCBP|nr:murein biosynthesis integral membrane protein MurJ [Buchnera aphidicola]Q89AI1.1 RecName: Full=Probable lipid II flippase MurJ [Buchnera aphidicola str. Bp (Baizongia pistaciae)]AAO27031.1 virulence factor MviN [Buchnera aphidicola str. Bp (Baizongia pistaciae)]
MNILKSLISLSLITFISRILGFMRDLLIAYSFGASGITDAFFLAFKIPNLFRRIFAEGAFSQVFIPILSEYKNNKNIELTRNFISNILGLMIIILSLFTAFGIYFANDIVKICAPGFINSHEKLYLATKMLKIMFPYIFFVSLGSLTGSILNAWNYFSVPAYSSIFLNLSMIMFISFVTAYFNPKILSLAWAVIVGGVFQILYQFPYLKNINMLIFPKFNILNLGVLKFLKQIGIVALGMSVNQVSIIIATISSSFLISGSISWIYYSDRLVEFISGIFGVSLSTILLPLLSKSVNNINIKEYSRLLNWALRLVCILVIPSIIILFTLSESLITLLFKYGAFTYNDVIMTKNVIEFYSIGLLPFVLIKILLAGFYSIRNVKTPMKISIFILVLTQLMNIFFIKYFQYTSFALAISLASWINFFLLYRKLCQSEFFIPSTNWLRFLLKIFAAAMVMLILLFINKNLILSANTHSIFFKILRLFYICASSGGGYLFTLFCLGLRFNHFYLKSYKY